MSIPNYDTIDELWLDTLDDLIHNGNVLESRVGKCVENLGFVARLNNPRANFLVNPVRKLSPSYAGAETFWYLQQTSDTSWLQNYAPSYKRFTEDGVNAYGAYGDRWVSNPGLELGEQEFMDGLRELNNEDKRVARFLLRHTKRHVNSQLIFAALALMLHPESRQVVIAQWDSGDIYHAVLVDKKDIPCTLTLQFIVRDNKLNMVVNMRSNDAWLGLPYDIFAFTTIQQLVANMLGLELGWYQHQATSMHLYYKNGELARHASDERYSVSEINTSTQEYPFGEAMEYVGRSEDLCRTNGTMVGSLEPRLLGSPFGLLYVMMASKWVPTKELEQLKVFPFLVKYIDKFYRKDQPC